MSFWRAGWSGRYTSRRRFVPSVTAGGTLYELTLSGTLSTAGALVKDVSQAKAGTLTSAGALAKAISKSLAGTLTTAGAVANVRAVLRDLAGTLTTAGALAKSITQAKAGALTTAGALAKQAQLVRAGFLGPGYALRFYGGGSGANVDKVKVQIGESSNALNVGQSDFSIELWMRSAVSQSTHGTVTAGSNYSWINGSIFVDRDLQGSNGAGGDWGACLDGSGRVAFGLENASAAQRTIVGTTDLRDDAYHYVVIQRARSSGDMSVYVDGTREAHQAGGPSGDVHYDDTLTPGANIWNPWLCFGGEKHDLSWNGQWAGRIDSIRISSSLRGSGTTMTVPTAPFEVDGSTVALYDCNDRAGLVLRDRSTNALHATLYVGGSGPGPSWEVSTAPVYGLQGAIVNVRAVLREFAGTLTTVGALAKLVTKPVAGTLTTAGAFVKTVAQAKAGTLTTAGVIVNIKAILREFAGTLTTAGSLAKATSQAKSGAMTPAGALTKDASKPLAGTLTTSGAIVNVKGIFQSLSGSLTTAGSLVKVVAHSRAGTLTPAGALTKDASKPLVGALVTAGALTMTRVVLLAVSGVLTLSGALVRVVGQSVGGTLTTSGALVKVVSKGVSGALTLVGAIINQSSVASLIMLAADRLRLRGASERMRPGSTGERMRPDAGTE